MSIQNKTQDKSLCSKERNLATTYANANNWHWLSYYISDLQYITKDDIVLDVGCGVGLGASILAEKAKKVIAIDDSKETIEFAKLYWNRPNIEYFHKDAFEETNIYDVVVAHEVVEHIKEIDKIFELFSKITKKYLIVTAPLDSEPIDKTPSKKRFHWKHYSIEEMTTLFNKNNFEVLNTMFMGKPYYVGKKMEIK
jgi:SAM-dependent methyltransferase